MTFDEYKWEDLSYPTGYIRTLFDYVQAHPFKKGLEIGFDQGASALAFLRACQDATLFSIDIEPCVVANAKLEVSDVKDRFKFMQADSRLMLREAFQREHHMDKFDFIYIDGDHLYDAVKQDLWNANNLLAEGGYMIVDDANPNHQHFGVGRAVQELAEQFGYKITPLEGSPSEAVILTK